MGIAAIVVLLLVGTAVWVVVDQITGMPGPRHRSAPGLPTDDERGLAARLRSHVDELAETPRPGRDARAQARTLDCIERRLRAFGCVPERQSTGPPEDDRPNLLVRLEGRRRDLPVVVVGAHYDTVPMSPGADDNASGVAVLLELARLLHDRVVSRGIVLAFFSEEEVDMRGSRFLAADLRRAGSGVEGMLSLEMLGFYSSEEGSQRYPHPVLGWLYPRRGNFVTMAGNLRSRAWVRRCVGAFRRGVAFPCEGIAAPEALRDIFRSDNAAFWHEGVPALMVTDTSNFRNPHYHAESDVPSTLDYAAMARVTLGLAAVLEQLSGE